MAHGIPGQGQELRLEQVFEELKTRLGNAGLPVPVESDVRGARKHPFAVNAAWRAAGAAMPAPPPSMLLSLDVREKYRAAAHEAQAGRPPDWSMEGWTRTCDALGPGASRVRDTAAALRDATVAKHVFAAVGGPGLTLTQLRYFYYLAAARWPDGASADALLVEAAFAAIAERKKKNPPDVTALARFVLGVAHECGHEPSYPALAVWLTSIGHSVADAQAYLRDEGQRPPWLVITFTENWPTEVSALLLKGDTELPFQPLCHPPGEGGTKASKDWLAGALRQIVDTHLPPEAVVDLEMPAHLLHLGMERWPVIESYGSYETLSERHQPRLRWSRRRGVAEAALRARIKTANWAGSPMELRSPEGDTRKSVRRQLQEKPAAPYVIGRQAGADADVPGLLHAALIEGCGFILWFPADADGEILAEVAMKAKGVQVKARRQLLPDAFHHMDPVPPTVIWDDPDGRAGYRLPRAAAEGPGA